MLPVLKQVGVFVNRHRNKIILSAAIVVAVGALGTVGYITYSSSSSDESGDSSAVTDQRRQSKLLNSDSGSSSSRRAGQRTRLLLQIRRQFDIACEQFLPTLRGKIVSEVDINGTVRRIKEMRTAAIAARKESSGSSSNDGGDSGAVQSELEEQLWDDIKDASFVMMTVSAYMLAAVCALLKLQLHVLARSLSASSSVATAANTSQQQQLEQLHDSEMFRLLIEGTYKQLFGAGLVAFTALVKQRVAEDLRDWKVKQKTAVEYDDLVQVMSLLRSNIEADFERIIRSVFIPPEAYVMSSTINSSAQTEESSDSSQSVQLLLHQIWDLVESQNFQEVYTESVDSCFRIMFQQLRQSAFLQSPAAVVTAASGIGSNSSSGGICSSGSSSSGLRTPPLASLLPQIKSVALNLLPASTQQQPERSSPGSDVVTPEVREIASGPFLEAFCIAIFDAPW